MVNYRRLYEKHYGIKIPPEYDVHHIDFNRENNEIDNLILLPKALHHRLHLVNLSHCMETSHLFDFRGISRPHPALCQLREEIENALDVYEEIQFWSACKNEEDLALSSNYMPYYNYSIFRR